MRAIEKEWTVVYTISEARKITPSNEPCTITIEAFSSMSKDDVEKILRKLDKDDGVINLIHAPDSWAVITPSTDPDAYKYVIGVLPAFQNIFEDTYRRYHQGIHKLGVKNFLAIHELVLDIEQEIEMADSNTITVDVLNHTMRFPSVLFPTDSPHFRDAYCELRIKSAEYLKRHGAIKSYGLIDNDSSGWDVKMKIEFDPFAFDGFADKTKGRYKEEFYRKPAELDGANQAHDEEPAAHVTEKIDIHRPLQPSHYHDKSGKLDVSPNVEVPIALRGKVARKNRTKYDQCHLMTCLFKNVNTLKNGVTFSTFLRVKYDKNNKKHIRKIRNTIDEINKKVAEKTTAKKLIFAQGDKIFIDKSYLKN
ncbi:MAG: hypothetical protein ACREHG_00985 [Candidatus Saccharimonadales bacterium]